ncbi:hypothetical protein HEP74_00139 [Xanthomonas sp. SS]|nr:hypothetical protein HEP74_00139 [Xanthomonas sp. SS]
MRVATPRAPPTPRDAARRTLTPTPLPRGEGLRLLPSPVGRRCPAGADEGTGAASCTQTPRDASRRTLTPTPLPTGEGLRLLPSPIGRRWPEGADEGTGGASHIQTSRDASRRTLTPTPLPVGEGLRLCPSPIGRRCPAGADEGPDEASCTPNSARRFRAGPSAQPLSRRERGLSRQYFFSTLNIQVWSLPLSPSVTPRYSTRVDRPCSVVNTAPSPSISRLRSNTLSPVRYSGPPSVRSA